MNLSTAPAQLYGNHPIFSEAQTSWVNSEGSVQLRLAKWAQGDRGTVHIFNGRTEYIERYADMIAEFQARGFAVTAHDWRGQGLSTRNEKHPERTHITDFNEFQIDAKAVMNACLDMPSPRILYCHSMGGAIGLRFLSQSKIIDSAIFSAPMWGIYMPTHLRPFAKIITNYVKKNNREWSCCAGTNDAVYESYTPFWRNLLTTNRNKYTEIRNNLEKYPQLGLGGPTYYWYFAAQREIQLLQNIPVPNIESLVFLGDNEKLVDPTSVKNFCGKAENLQLFTLKNCKHEPYIERRAVREEMWSQIDRFLSKY